MENSLTKIALNTQWQECPQLQLFSWKFFEHFAPKRHVKVAITQCASTHKRVIQKMVLAPIVSQMESQQRKAHQNFIHGLVLALSSCPLSLQDSTLWLWASALHSGRVSPRAPPVPHSTLKLLLMCRLLGARGERKSLLMILRHI